MTFFLLPKLNNQISIDMIEIELSENENDIYGLSKSLKYYVNSLKQKIDDINSDWDIFKKYTNPYEYIHTTVPGKKKSVAKLVYPS